MQRLLNDIKEHKLDKLVAIKTDRLTRNNYDGFWLLNYCEEHDDKIELILEPYDPRGLLTYLGVSRILKEKKKS